jgi:hypothetical protein
VHDILEFEKCAWPPVHEKQRDCRRGTYARGLVDEVDVQIANRCRVVVPLGDLLLRFLPREGVQPVVV